jgi:hypothetical protein
MITEYARDDSHRQITVTTGETVDGADLWGIVERQAREGIWSYNVLYDERRSTMALTPNDFRRLLSRIEELNALHGLRGRVAIVAGSASELELLTIYSELAGTVNVASRAFLSLDAAQAWLDEAHAGV